MDEIKFRAWDKRRKIMSKQVIIFGKDSDLAGQADRVFVDCQSDFLEETWDFNIECEDFIWMQFTGLKDKNDKNVYEGDILTNMSWSKDYTKGVVVFHGGQFRVATNEHSMKYYAKTGYCEDGVCCALFYILDNQGGHIGHNKACAEVIGNIYENPELINTQNQNKKNEVKNDSRS